MNYKSTTKFKISNFSKKLVSLQKNTLSKQAICANKFLIGKMIAKIQYINSFQNQKNHLNHLKAFMILKINH